MEEGLVPIKKGMRITGHQDAKSYAKYNAHILEAEQRACQDLISGDSVLVKGKRSSYLELVCDQDEKIEAKKVIHNLSLVCCEFDSICN
jgi:hypothetical protein